MTMPEYSDIEDEMRDEEEEEEEEEEINEGLELRDIRQRRSKSLSRSVKSASSKFTQFLAYQNNRNPALHPYVAYVPQDMDPEYFTPTLFGKFADYMIHVDNRDHQTVESYCHASRMMYMKRMR